jgi:hypothetical protein
MYIGLAMLTPADPTRDHSYDEWCLSLGRVNVKITCHFPLPRLNLSQLARLANKWSTYVKLWPILEFFKLEPLFCTQTTLLVLRWARIQCAESSLVILIFVSTIMMCVNSPWLDSFSRAFVHAQNGGWSPHKKLAVPGFRWEPLDHAWSCFFRRLHTTSRWRLILIA